MKAVVAYLLLCIGFGVWSLVDARVEELKRARARLAEFKRRAGP